MRIKKKKRKKKNKKEKENPRDINYLCEKRRVSAKAASGLSPAGDSEDVKTSLVINQGNNKFKFPIQKHKFLKELN